MNFKHLRYFWTVAKAGGVMRAGEQLHTTPQTLSGQIKQLEGWLGHDLFRKRGRGLELTSEGRVALGYAEQIFALGDELEKSIRLSRGQEKPLEFRVGVADSIAKSVAYHLLEPALGMPQRVHGAFVADDEVHRVVEYLKRLGPPRYVEEVLAEPEEEEEGLEGPDGGEEHDPLYDQAVEVVLRTRRPSISLVQRHLRIGYNRAARLIEAMERAGLVSPPEHNGNRQVLVPARGEEV